MLVDFDDVFVEHALKHGYVSADQVAEAKKVQKDEQGDGRRYYIGQILIRRRFLSCGDFLEIENELGHKLYECSKCKARYGVSDLSEKGTVACKGCGAEVKIDGGLSIVEILASRDPRDLTISLCPTDASQVPVAPASPLSQQTKVQTSARLTSLTPGKPALANGEAQATVAAPAQPVDKKSKSRLNRAVLELSRDDLSGLQRYEVLDELGRGGMGIVFKAKQIDIDRICALKVIKAGPAVPEVQINRFVQEARSAAQLNHPNIVTIYDFGRFRDMFYIAMEFIPGTPLSKLISDNAITHEKALQITDDLLGAAAYAHSKGVIHRDLKPQNILIENDRGRARLIDFGLAKDNTGGLGLTQTGQILGSPFYLSPEQTRGESRNVDPRSDVFAIGVILYEMLTHVRPFTGKSAAEVYAKILKERPVPPSAVEPDIEPPLQSIVLRALEKTPEDRFQTADDFQRALKSYREGRPVEEPRPSGKARAVTARMEKPSGSTARGSAIMKRSSDRATTKRTSATIATITASDRFPRAPRSSNVGIIVAAVAAVAVGGVVLVAGSGHGKTTESQPQDDPHGSPVVTPIVTRTTTDPVQPAVDEEADVKAAILAETDSGVPYSIAIKNWNDIGSRYATRYDDAHKRATAITARADAECDQLLRAADESAAQFQWGRADQDLQAALLRFRGIDAATRIEQKRKTIADGAFALAVAATGDSDARLAQGDFAGAIAAVSSPERTGIAQADRMLQDQRSKVEAEKARRATEADAAQASERDKVPRLTWQAYELTKQRKYDESLQKYDEALAAPLEDLARRQIRLKRDETVLIQSVLRAALQADIDQAIKQKRDVTIEVAKNVKLPAIRVKDGTLFANAKGSEVEYDVRKLPAKGVARLQDLAAGGQEGQAILGRALFLLAEGELGAARGALDLARKAGVDVSSYESRFPAPPEPPPSTTGTEKPPTPTPPKTPDEKPEKPIKDVNALLAVEAGQFRMGYGENGGVISAGRDNEWPEHKVTLHDYRIGKYEVTNGQYKRFLDWIATHKSSAHKYCHDTEPANHDHTPAVWKSPRFGGDNYPVVGVDWWDAYACCRFLGGRLPTEAEWERAARGTDDKPYPWGKEFDWKKCVCASFVIKDDALSPDVWDKFQDFVKNMTHVTMPADAVDEGKSPVGAYNMAGNAAEWTSDWYSDKYYGDAYMKGTVTDPPGPETGSQRVVRGGSWADRLSTAFLTTARKGLAPGTRVEWLGFRCAGDAK